DNIERVRELLQLQLPGPGQRDLRGFEWHYWDRRAHGELQVVRMAEGMTHSLDPEGTRVVGLLPLPATNETYIGVWDVATGKRLPTIAAWTEAFQKQLGFVMEARFSDDGRRILLPACYQERPDRPVETIVGVWDAVTGKELHTIRGIPEGAGGLTLSSDTRHYALCPPTGGAGNPFKAVTVRDSATGKDVWTV